MIIYMQRTIDYMHKINPASLIALERDNGRPEIKEFMSTKGDNIRYYKFILKA